MKKIRVGIVGTGFSATSHLEALKRLPNVEVVAVVSRSREKAEEFAEKFNIKYAYSRMEDLLKHDEIEVVHNCTPNSLHFPINKMVIEAGKHILSEKPLALNSDESRVLVELAKENNVINGVCFNYRHYPLVREAKTQIENNLHGEVYLVYGGYVQDWLLYPTDYSWRLEKSVNGASRAIADIGSHWCDTIQTIIDKKIIRVFADLQTVHKTRKKPLEEVATFSKNLGIEYDEVTIDTEDAGHVIVQFEGGAKGAFTVSQVSAGRKNKLFFEVSTEKSTIAWDQEKPNELWIGKRDVGNETLMRDPSLLSPESKHLAHYPGGHQEGWPDALKNLFLEFYDHVQNPEKSPVEYATFEDGHYIMKVIDAILKSHQLKQWVEIR